MLLRKKKVDMGALLKKKRQEAARAPMSKEESNARVKAVLAQLSGKDFTVLAKVQSESSDRRYEIRMGSNNAVYCECKGWQFSKTGTCKHIERFKREHKAVLIG